MSSIQGLYKPLQINSLEPRYPYAPEYFFQECKTSHIDISYFLKFLTAARFHFKAQFGAVTTWRRLDFEGGGFQSAARFEKYSIGGHWVWYIQVYGENFYGYYALKAVLNSCNVFPWKFLIILYHCFSFVCAWLYYGGVLLTTSFLQYDPHCGM